MQSLTTLIEQVRAQLIKTEDTQQRHEIYSLFINESKSLNLSEEDFYKKVLKEAHKSINWSFIEEEKKKKESEKLEKEERERQLQLELEEVKKQKKFAPQFIDRLIKTAFEDDVLERSELTGIFEKADQLGIDPYELAEKIDGLINEKGYKSYPRANFDLPSLRQTLCSTDWQSPGRYLKLTTPPPEPFPWKMVIGATLLISVFILTLTYFFYLKPKWKDEAAPRYFTVVQDAILRSSPIAGVDYNKITTLGYGAELITYDAGVDWCQVKTNDQEGFVSTKLVAKKSDFYLLNSIFGDPESKQVIETNKCRRALLSYFTNKNYMGKMDAALQTEAFDSVQTGREVWQVFAKGKDVKPNSVFYPKKIVNPSSKFSDFAVVIKNLETNKRKFLLFTFSDTEEPILVDEQDAPDTGDIKDVRKSGYNGNIVYVVKWSN
ncbi:MAG: SH3 domain-containing protein [Bacteroidetes bacterium]|nr:SH3 domain-containing protein [Bacteroidota bacterium]